MNDLGLAADTEPISARDVAEVRVTLDEPVAAIPADRVAARRVVGKG